MNTSKSIPKTLSAKKLGKRALVIGASLAGLTAARVLSDYFLEVTLIERDSLPDKPVARSGVPQSKHMHVLLIRGQQILERLFPGFTARMDQAGVPYVQWMTEVRAFLANGWLTRNDLKLTTRTSSRPNLEWLVRQELAKISNVSFLENCQVDTLITDNSRERVTGLAVSFKHAAGGQSGKSETLEADLVVDASGRASKLPDWLKSLGYEPPIETRVNPRLSYATRLYSNLSIKPDWKIMGINAKGPDQPRGGAINIQEGGQWIVTLFGYGRQHQPPTDPDEFLSFAHGMASPEMYDVLKTATPIADPYGYANTGNVWRHYDQLKRFPNGLAVLGDAVCCFNPVYGQGMTTAAIAAEILDQSLSRIESLDSLGMSFQNSLAKVVGNSWLLATGSDFQFPETEGERPGGLTSVAQGYFDRLLSMIHNDAQVACNFIQVLNMVKTPVALFSPPLVMKVLTRSSAHKTATLVD